MKQTRNTVNIVRGGSWLNSARYYCSAVRTKCQPDYRYGILGFRIVSCSPDTKRVIRGGSWFNGARYCRSAFRFQCQPDYPLSDLGFRVLQVP